MNACKADGCTASPSRGYGEFCRNHGVYRRPDTTGLFGGHYGCSLDCIRDHAKDMAEAVKGLGL